MGVVMDEQKSQDEQKVVVTCQVTDIRMPFWSMVVFMVKWVFASIPAMIIFSLVAGVIMAVLSIVFGSVWGFHGMFHQIRLPF
jgi:hypothetical protein